MKISLLLLILFSSYASFAKTQAYVPYPPLISCSLEDSKGNLWFGTPDGVYHSGPKEKKKKEAFLNFTTEDGLPDNVVLCILEDQKGNIWFGTKSGLCVYNANDSTKTKIAFTSVPILISNSTYFQDSKEKTEVQREIWSMARDKTGRIWLGTNEGAFHFQPDLSDGKEQLFTYFLHYDYTDNPYNVALNAVTSILEDQTGKIWFTTWFEGLCCYDGKSITKYTPEGKVWFAIIFEDKSGNLWLGSRDHGVYYYALSSGPVSSESFVNVFPDTEIFNTCAVQVITQDQSGNMWFGAEYDDLSEREYRGGLWCYSVSSSKPGQKELFRNFTMEDGLPNNSVFDLLVDKSGKIWIGTRKGLCSLDTRSAGKKRQHFEHYELPMMTNYQ